MIDRERLNLAGTETVPTAQRSLTRCRDSMPNGSSLLMGT